MSLSRNTLRLFSIAFFTLCIAMISHLFLSPLNSDTKRAFSIYFLVYGGLFSAWEIFKHRNAPNYGIFVGRAIGATLGFVAIFYCSYLICILVGISDSVTPIDSSDIAVAICFGSGEFGRQIGSFFGNVLLPA